MVLEGWKWMVIMVLHPLARWQMLANVSKVDSHVQIAGCVDTRYSRWIHNSLKQASTSFNKRRFDRYVWNHVDIYIYIHTFEPMPGRTHLCNSPGYGTHLNFVCRSLKTVAGPSLDWAVKLLSPSSSRLLFADFIVRWDSTATLQMLASFFVHPGLRDWRHSHNYCEHGRLYLSLVLLMLFQYPFACLKESVYCTALIQIRRQKACSLLIAI